MACEGQPESTKSTTVGQNQQTDTVPQHRSGVNQGVAAKISAKWKVGDGVQITEIKNGLQHRVRLVVASVGENPGTGKAEYQLKESNEATELYNGEHVYAEVLVQRLGRA